IEVARHANCQDRRFARSVLWSLKVVTNIRSRSRATRIVRTGDSLRSVLRIQVARGGHKHPSADRGRAPRELSGPAIRFARSCGSWSLEVVTNIRVPIEV